MHIRNDIEIHTHILVCVLFVWKLFFFSDLRGRVQVYFSRYEEYTTATGGNVWRTIYFVEVDDQPVPVVALQAVDLVSFNTRLSVVTGI